MKAKFIPLYIAALSLTNLSCEKFLQIDQPKDQVLAGVAFSDEKIATSTVLGIYSNMNGFNNQFGSSLLSILMSITADDYYYAVSSYDAYKQNALLSTTSNLDRLWSQPYAYINQANIVIEGVAASNLSEAVKQQLSGEAKFVRAFSYFYLVNIFNKVPLVNDTDIEKNKVLGQSTKQEIYEFMIQDLNEAIAGLSDAYQGAERVRPNKKAAQALLARVYLYNEKWDLAEAMATTVISDTRYKIATNLNTVFLRNSEEAIWQLQTVNTSTAGVNTWEGFSIVPPTPTSQALYRVYPVTAAKFEAGDKRRADWLKPYVTATTTFYYPTKYKFRTSTPVTEYNTVLRLAEQYLIRAEARANQNNPAKLVQAIDDVNVIRGRANLTALSSTLVKADALLAIESERQLELLGEWGHRWFDLIRTNRAVPVLSVSKANGFNAADQLIPISEETLKTNPKLTQND